MEIVQQVGLDYGNRCPHIVTYIILLVIRAAAENVAFAFCLMADVLLIAAIIVVAVAGATTKEIAKIGGILGIVAGTSYISL